MEDHWKDKHVNMYLLSERIARFFKEKTFATIIRKIKEGHEITAVPKSFHNVTENIKVFIIGQPDDFTVKFIAGSYSRSLIFLGNLLTLLGGGIFVREGLKSQEMLEKLEKQFWIYIDGEIQELMDSASTP